MGSDPKAIGVSMVKIGETLKEAREKRSVTIDQVQKQTRIYSTVLHALEEGRCDSMLTPTYVKSFLKKYAEYLGLDARQILNDYAKLCHAASMRSAQTSITSKAEVVPPIDLSKYIPVIKRAVVILVSIALIMFVGGKVVRGFKKWKKSRAMAVSVKAQTKSRRASPAPSKKKVVTHPAATVKKPAAKGRNAAKAAITSPLAPISKTAPLKLLISVKQTVLVKVRADGSLLFSKVLPRGSVESFSAKDRFNIYVAKGEAVEFYLNGRSLGFAGKGLLKDVEVTRNGLKVK